MEHRPVADHALSEPIDTMIVDTRPTSRQMIDLSRRLTVEALGTALLLAIVTGSGIMGERLAGGNTAVALLANALATGAGLVALITCFAPISGAHFNPVVTIVLTLRREIDLATAAAYIVTQCASAILGVWLAHLMFGEALLQISAKHRDGVALIFSEVIATFGLIMTILASSRVQPTATPVLVGLYITAAYWFTASTSFANPAVTLARMLSDTFVGIAPTSAIPFILAQFVGAGVAFAFCGWLFRES